MPRIFFDETKDDKDYEVYHIGCRELRSLGLPNSD